MQTKQFKQLSKLNLLRVLTKLFRHDRLYTVKEIAELLDKSEKVIYYQIRVNNLPAERHYGKLLVRESDLNEFREK